MVERMEEEGMAGFKVGDGEGQYNTMIVGKVCFTLRTLCRIHTTIDIDHNFVG